MTDLRDFHSGGPSSERAGSQDALIVRLVEVGAEAAELVGSKAANLGELTRITAVEVPAGICLTTAAYDQLVLAEPAVQTMLGQLAAAAGRQQESERIAARLRRHIAGLTLPDILRHQIVQCLTELGADRGYAVRSSGTAEDLPSAAFAGQQDTYLNVRGIEAVLDAVQRCWASLFTDRAVSYRIRQGISHVDVRLAVVIQHLVDPHAAGVMFTADPVSGHRRMLAINACLGLGEALVSGLVQPDSYTVRDRCITSRQIGTQTFAIRPSTGGGTRRQPLEPSQATAQVLTDNQIRQLAEVGHLIEQHFASPQDIEWCLTGDRMMILQSRPITTLYPVPKGDGRTRVYLSYGHRQMMTDAFKPLGISFFALLDESLGRPAMTVAGSRFYKDISHELASPVARRVLLSSLGLVDTVMQNAIRTVLARHDLMTALPRGRTSIMDFGRGGLLPMARQLLRLRRRNEGGVVPELIAANEDSITGLTRAIAERSGDELFAFIEGDHHELADIMFEPRSVAAAFLGIAAARWLDKHLERWLGETNAADALAQAAPHNVVADMGLCLLDVADAARAHPEVVDYLAHPDPVRFFDGLAELDGGMQFTAVLRNYLDQFGMHCSGDIDITRTRWSEDPAALAPLILANVANFGPGEHQARVQRSRREADRVAADLLGRLRDQPRGTGRARRAERQIQLLRNFIGYREFSKHALLQRYGVYKQALLKEAHRLLDAGVLHDRDDVYFLTLEEFRTAVRTGAVDAQALADRRAAYDHHTKLPPPRLITSDGEIINGEHYQTSRPAGALPGSPVSTGVVEGRARVVANLSQAQLAEGDILVTVFLDPSWSPVLVSAAAVVLEIGGTMTHGAVLAREYAVPAVAGVVNATNLIRDGQLIRVNGTAGYVELLPHTPPGVVPTQAGGAS